MKFLIQKINNKVKHDFSFTLQESIEYQNWVQKDKHAMSIKYINYQDNKSWSFKPFHKNYVPVGSVEFVLAWFKYFHNHTPNPINIPEELFGFCYRKIFNGNHMDLENLNGKYFIKSNDRIKGVTGIFNIKNNEIPVPIGNYQISELIDIESEWRAFVYKNQLVGLQNYCGHFSTFPNIKKILYIIHSYKSPPTAYTLDIGVYEDKTFPIECHDFFSCGLYGFADHKLLPYMFYRWHHEYLKKINK